MEREVVKASQICLIKLPKFKEAVVREGWSIGRGVRATKWMIDDALGWNGDSVTKKIDEQTFEKHDLGGMLEQCFRGDVFDCIDASYPGDFQRWEFSKLEQQPWDFESAMSAVKWTIEEKLVWGRQDIVDNYSGVFLKNNRLGEVAKEFESFKLLDAIYPEQFKPWELKSYNPHGFWNKKNTIKSVKWMVEDKLGVTYDEACKLSKKTVCSCGIVGAYNWFGGSVLELINFAYNGVLPQKGRMVQPVSTKSDEMIEMYQEILNGKRLRFPRGFFDNDRRKDSYGALTRYLVETVLEWKDIDYVKKNLHLAQFNEYFLGGMINVIYRNNVSEALKVAYGIIQ